MKKIVLLVLMAAMTVGCLAIPARPGQWKIVKLEDGAEVKLELKGDEHIHYWQAEDGRAFLFDEASQCYRQTDISKLEYHMPMEFEKMQTATGTIGVRRTLGVPHEQPLTGEMRGLFVMVEFSDTKFQSGHDKALYEKILNQKDYQDSQLGFVGSVRDYFLDQSQDRFDFQFDVVGPVTASNKATYYGGSSGYDHMADLIGEVLNKIKADIDFSVYDNDKDGEIDLVFFQYAGKGAHDGGTNCIWPHMFWYKKGWGKSFSQNGVKLDTYACASEMQSYSINGIGAVVHEFSHCLGIPDMYNSENMSNVLHEWSVMDIGCYNGNTFCPAGYNAYELDFCGWQKIQELDDNAEFTGVAPLSEGGMAYKITNKKSPKEYFIVEPRYQSKWDKEVPANGFLIYHVDYTNTSDWTQNYVNVPSKNKTGHNNISIVPANNNMNYTSGYVFPYNGLNKFDDDTNPSSALYYKNADDSKKLHKGVYDMKLSGKKFSFRFECEPEYSGIEQVDSERITVNSEKMYNLAGQRVAGGYKGLLIVNGRKVVGY